MSQNRVRQSRAFTLVEMLIVISIISIIAGMSMAALLGAAEEGRLARARAQIEKIDQLISEKWNGYRFRQLPLRIGNNVTPKDAARMRLEAIRELQRFEMPDRLSDVVDVTTGALLPTFRIQTQPSLARAYARKITPLGRSNLALEQSECLYLIISEIRDGDKSALEFFMNSEIGDLDSDGMNEILDPWGTPIVFLRWAPGFIKYASNDGALGGANIPTVPHAESTFQTPLGLEKPDTFDPLKADPRWGGDVPPPWSNMSTVFRPFHMRPLILSAGPDRLSDLATDFPGNFIYATTPITRNDPYVVMNGNTNLIFDISQPATTQWRWMGVQCNLDVLASTGEVVAPRYAGDNITNHGIELQGE